MQSKKILVYILLVLGALTMLLPFFWMVSTAFKTGFEVLQTPPTWLPKHFQWGNWVRAWQAAPFATYLINSVVVSLATTLGQLVTSILAAFAFAKLNFSGKKVLFTILLATMMVPGEMLIIPNFVTLSELHLVNTYGALIVPWLASFFAVFTLRQSFASVPDQLYYAARLDGASDWQFLWLILVPNAKSTITAIGLLQIIGSWNSFMWPLIVTNTEKMRTLPVGLQAFSSDSGVQYPELMAASTFVILPMVVMYLLLNKYVVAGISNTGIKG
ncbi:carbohydrate ABC transporter permease [Weissella cibaria]|uniref:carbohydrate ABC transporter permease n=1 Tax=Weissella cibaria TaxID=137591 RepID=UPI00223AB13D|nr:carbohydrate ABC transporter permease [Weissella cibaria]MCT0957221.1 carbohydrate ABC transporter permease [Weissella cibaria]